MTVFQMSGLDFLEPWRWHGPVAEGRPPPLFRAFRVFRGKPPPGWSRWRSPYFPATMRMTSPVCTT